MRNGGVYQRGETITFPVPVAVGAVTDISGLPTANLKPLPLGSWAVPGSEVATVGTFSVAPDPTAATPGFTITLSAAQTAALPVGRYVTDVRAVLNSGAVKKSEPLFFKLTESVTT